MGTPGTDAYQSIAAAAAAWDAGMWGEDKLNSSAKLGGLKGLNSLSPRLLVHNPHRNGQHFGEQLLY